MKSCSPPGSGVHRPDSESYRQSDWRFLLPTARQERVRDVTDQRLAQLLSHRPDPSSAACDVVLGSDPRREHFARAFAALRPGGVCYFEWRSWLRPTAGSLLRRFQAVGFAGIRLYWSWPPGIPSAWVPLDAPATVRWVLRSRHRVAVERVWRMARAAHLLRPRCATAVRPPFAGPIGPLGTSFGDLGGDPIWALVAPGDDPLNKVLAFVGVRGRQVPAFVLKMPRAAAAAASLEHEAASLRVLESAGKLPEGVPRLLFVARGAGDLRAIAESPLEGRPLFQVLDRRRYPALVGRATEWLVELALATTPGAERAERTPEVAEEVAVGSAPRHRELLLEAGRLASAADRLPVVFEQRDFSPWNVHVGRDGGLVVYDWESAEPAGFPALDLVYLIAYCGFFLDGALASGRTRESYRATLGGAVAEGCLTQYCLALGIDPDLRQALRVLTWLVHARSTLRRDPSGASAALFLDLLREEIGAR